ncbi:restriction endonuclease [Streptomyces sp. NPDC017993]|uniref:restriction endonuclease n=1 Tax=Streptomyces sp. NPDC017993 TaxID=3365027 RepID=UPI0037B3E1BE
MASWHDYQEEVAEFLRSMGFTAAVDVTLEGARGSHDLDVVGTYEKTGICFTWIVECKQQERRVEKSKVLTFIGIVQDVGADRGLFVADSGFQSGAIQSAGKTNVTLTTLPGLREKGQAELTKRLLIKADLEAANLLERLHAIGTRQRRPGVISRSYKNVEGVDLLTLTGKLSCLQTALDKARRNQWPVRAVRIDSDRVESLRGEADLLEFSDNFIRGLAPLVAALECANKKTR